MDSLHEEVVELTRDLVRLDTRTRRASPRQRDAGGPSPRRLPRRRRHRVRAGGPGGPGAPGEPGREGARAPTASGTAPSLAFVGHIDVVPVDARDWTHPPFEGVLTDDGYLWGRGVLDMKGEVAARAVAIKELVRSGWRPRGDLWFLAVADEEDGMADVGMRWLLEARPDIRPDLSINEGGGELFELTDGRRLVGVGIGEKGTYPVRVTARRRGRPRQHADGRRQRRPPPRRGDRPGRPRPAGACEAPARRPDARGAAGPCRVRRPAGSPGGRRPAAPRAGAPDAGAGRHHDGADHGRRLRQAQRDAEQGLGGARLPHPAGHDRGRRRGGGA